MKHKIILIVLMSLNLIRASSQTKTPLTDELEKDNTFELGITYMSLGKSFFDGDLSKTVNKQLLFLFTPIILSVHLKKISFDTYFSLIDFRTTQPSNYLDNIWEEKSDTRTMYWGLNLGYQILKTKHLNLIPMMGIDFNNISQPWATDTLISNQNGRILLRPVINLTLEYRLFHKELFQTTSEESTEWGDRYLALVLRSGFLYSPHLKNLGIGGNQYNITLGFNYSIGNYKNLKRQ